MCGISGIVRFANEKDYISLLKGMQAKLQHRGPDSQGQWHNERVFFAHNRLSIIDLSLHGHQPMVSADARYIITYNGEIYNYLELKEQCRVLGSEFFSNSDTEVILECYRHFGVTAFEKFRGMWALALYDTQTKTVVLSRDPFGIKPLYYGIYEGALYFASEPKALKACNDYFKEVDEVSVDLFITHGYLDRGDWTFYKNIKRFAHASYAIINLAKQSAEITPQKYWQPKLVRENICYDDAVMQLRELLIKSVRLHLRSDVPIGACLSGGVDSSAIVSIGNKVHQQNFKTFTIFYDTYAHVNERMWAEKIVAHTGSEGFFVEPTFQMFMQDFDALIEVQDEPFGSTSIYAQFAIFREISRQKIKVILDGQGSDEQFSGYLGFVSIYLSDLLNNGKYFAFLKEQKKLKENYQIALDKSAIYQHILLKLKRRKSNNSGPINITEFADTQEDRLKFLTYQPTEYEDKLSMLLTDSNIPQLLRYEDRNSMAFSIESRVPFLETDLVNFVLSLPANFKIRNGFTKAILRDAISGIVPDEVRLRISKLGFPTPEIEWLKQGFGVDVPTGCSKPWREIITDRWRGISFNK